MESAVDELAHKMGIDRMHELGAYVRPEIWREAVKPFYRALPYGGPERRPKLAPEVRAELVKDCLDDIGLLEEVLQESFDDWRSSAGRGSFKERTTS